LATSAETGKCDAATCESPSPIARCDLEEEEEEERKEVKRVDNLRDFGRAAMTAAMVDSTGVSCSVTVIGEIEMVLLLFFSLTRP
jgi:hypothetical protein